ncbi:MAG: hypothetical protein SCH70_14135 [Candidatus Methanoperedens sp.]|nr:hypothetical protein [Candidatus Methanoperedens sp.]
MEKINPLPATKVIKALEKIGLRLSDKKEAICSCAILMEEQHSVLR